MNRWADESAKFMCSSIYRNPITGKQITEELENGVFRLSEQLYDLWKREMLTKMLAASLKRDISESRNEKGMRR